MEHHFLPLLIAKISLTRCSVSDQISYHTAIHISQTLLLLPAILRPSPLSTSTSPTPTTTTTSCGGSSVLASAISFCFRLVILLWLFKCHILHHHIAHHHVTSDEVVSVGHESVERQLLANLVGQILICLQPKQFPFELLNRLLVVEHVGDGVVEHDDAKVEVDFVVKLVALLKFVTGFICNYLVSVSYSCLYIQLSYQYSSLFFWKSLGVYAVILPL